MFDLLDQLSTLHAAIQEQPQPIAEQKSGISDQNESDHPEPIWMASWRQAESFEQNTGVLKVIAETGLAHPPLIEAKAAEMLIIKKVGDSIWLEVMKKRQVWKRDLGFSPLIQRSLRWYKPHGLNPIFTGMFSMV